MVIQGKRAIAYFDILGFKAKIDYTPLNELAEKYENVVNHTDGEFFIKNGQIHNKQVCHRYIFSDSIFLVALEDTEESFADLISYAWKMMRMFIAAGFPLRGAITYGDIYINFEKNIFLGKCISQAVELEGKQEWIGAVVDNSAIDRYEAILSKSVIQALVFSFLLPIYDVPFKDGTRRNYSVINWRLNVISEFGTKPLFKNEPYSKEAQIKIENTLLFSKEVVEANLAYLQAKDLPQRYQRLYIGRGISMKDDKLFEHGDEY